MYKNRQERRMAEQAIERANKKIKKPYVIQRLPVHEQKIVEEYIKEASKAYLKSKSEEAAKMVVEKSWKDMETELIEAMRNHKISQERIEKIVTMMNSSLAVKSDLELHLDLDMKDFITLNQEDFALLASEAMDSTCKNCDKCYKECEMYKILKKKAIPQDPLKLNCVYAY